MGRRAYHAGARGCFIVFILTQPFWFCCVWTLPPSASNSSRPWKKSVSTLFLILQQPLYFSSIATCAAPQLLPVVVVVLNLEQRYGGSAQGCLSQKVQHARPAGVPQRQQVSQQFHQCSWLNCVTNLPDFVVVLSFFPFRFNTVSVDVSTTS